MTLKPTLFAGVLAATLAVPAFANDAPVAAPLPQFTTADTQMLFEQDAKPMQLAALSQQEMKETEGAWGAWGAAIGGLGGLGGYALNTHISGSSWSWVGAGAATFGGARAGAIAGPVGVVWGFNAAIGSGIALGVAQRYGW